MQKYRTSVLLTSPPTLIMLAKSAQTTPYHDLSSIKVIYSGAAPFGLESIENIMERMPGVRFGQGYGLSESALSVVQTIPTSTLGSVGRLKPTLWGKVIDVKTKQPLGPNQLGEMCFKGPLIMKGYLNNEEANKETMHDGWFHTGDIGYYTNDEEWYIADRIKELIKFKGLPVAPAEIEGVLLSHADIVDAAVIGIPDEYAGELSLGFVVKRGGAQLTEKDVIDYVASKLGHQFIY